MLGATLLSGCNSIDSKGNSVGLFDEYDWPVEQFDSALEKVAYDSHGLGYSDNCLYFATNVQKTMTAKYNKQLHIYYVIAKNQDHAIVCDGNTCVDNGFISDGQFARNDMKNFQMVGEVLMVNDHPYVMNDKELMRLTHWDNNVAANIN